MDTPKLFASIHRTSMYCVGIKGTGMAALAELLHKKGAAVQGSDTEEKFYTDNVLNELGIPFKEGFRKENLPEAVDVIVHSAAYDRETHPELQEGLRRGIPVLSYPEALGCISSHSESIGIAGTHGKTTTAALCGTIIKGSAIKASVLVGAAVSNLGGQSTYVGGDTYFIAETCEYRRHFLNFNPSHIVITSIEPDHLDYFSDYDDYMNAFVEYGQRLKEEGTLYFCADDPGAREASERIFEKRRDIMLVPYGKKGIGPYAVETVKQHPGAIEFTLKGWGDSFMLRVPGEHTVLNATAAIAVFTRLAEKEGISNLRTYKLNFRGVIAFRGSSRRSEVIGEAGGILFLDDYGHHPTEIRTTLSGLRDFYPGRRLVVDFMSHTFSRTQAFFSDFAKAFESADKVIFHKIYGSARESENEHVSGKKLYESARKHVKQAVYFHEVMDAKDYLLSTLREGDIFLTLGAGDNWRIGKAVFNEKMKEEK